MQHDVFISYASLDSAQANELLGVLEHHGIKCWIAPRDILPGESWAGSIPVGIENSRLMVLVFSKNANLSEHIVREVKLATDAAIPVVQLRVDDVQTRKELAYFLGTSQWVDATNPPFARHLDKLAAQLRLRLGPDTDPTKTSSSPAVAAEYRSRQTAASSALPSMARRKTTRLIAACSTLLLVALCGAAFVFRHRGISVPAVVQPQALQPTSQSSIDQLMSTARENDDFEHGHTALKAIDDLLKIDPRNAAAMALRSKIGWYYPPDQIGQAWANSIGMKMMYIPAGSYLMGSLPTAYGRHENEVPHNVTLTQKFMMASTPVTQAQWRALMGNNPSHFQGDELPVEQVNYFNADAFCKKLSEQEHRHYYIPTEAQWEYACRAGTTTAYYTGDGGDAMDNAGWSADNSGIEHIDSETLYLASAEMFLKRCSENRCQTHPVAQKQVSPWGLYDMHGNVRQWCSDWYTDLLPGTSAIDPTGPSRGDKRVLRGGSWHSGPRGCLSSSREPMNPHFQFNDIGFRPVLDFP